MNKKQVHTYLSFDFDTYQIHQILQKITGLSQKQLFFVEEISCQEADLDKYILQKKQGIPFEYILEKADFYGYDFFVDKRCLIPRNDTEIMVQSSLEVLWDNSPTTLIDVGTGSSCIAIALMNEAKKYKKNITNTYVVDISTFALEVSKINIQKFDLSLKIQQIQSNLLEAFLTRNTFILEKNLVITANLPYIKDGDFQNMDPQVYQREPHIALFWWKDTGFELYETLLLQIQQLKKHYNIEKIDAFFEIGFDQYEYSFQFLSQIGLKFEYFQDFHKIERCLHIEI